jgi:hypothetical protein
MAGGSWFGVETVADFSPVAIDGGGGRGGGATSGSRGLLSSRRLDDIVLLEPIGRQDGPGSREGRSAGERERREWLMLSPREELSRLLLLLRLCSLGALGGPYASFEGLSKVW